ncbi:MAG: DUF2807 domain-containing protein [Pseudomonadota bacterium]
MRASECLAAAALTVACASSLAAGETLHDLAGFNRISASDGIKVEVFSGSDYSVVSDVSGTARESRLIVSQDGDTLTIKRKGRSSMLLMGMADYYSVTVHLPELTAILAHRGVDVEVSGTFPDKFSATTSSGADLDIDGLDTAEVFLKASSGSDLDARGTCVTLEVQASSGSDIDAEELECRDVRAKASSGSDIEVHLTGTLNARASSGSDIDVEGTPKDVSVEESSGGDVSLPGA